jgi:hypothetical protein
MVRYFDIASGRSRFSALRRAARCAQDGCFFSADDRQEYLDLLSQSASKHALDFVPWCLMSHHAHFVVDVPSGEDRSRAGSEQRIADTPDGQKGRLAEG